MVDAEQTTAQLLTELDELRQRIADLEASSSPEPSLRMLDGSEGRFERLAESTSDIMYRYRLTPTPGFEYVSPSATNIVGYTPDEHYADPDLTLKIVHPDDQPLLDTYLQGSPAFDREPVVLRWIARDGSIVWTEARNVPVYDEAGGLTAIEGIARDVTHRVRMEERLRVFERAVEQSINGVAVTGMDGTVHFVNRAWAELHRCGTEEPLGQHLGVFHTEKQLQKDIEPFITHLEKEGTYRGEVGHVTKDGVPFPTWMAATVLTDDNGQPSGFLLVAQDITERKMLEEEVFQARKMESLVRLAGAVSNDFNNLLTAIMGNSALGMAAARSDDRVHGYLEQIQKAAERGAELTGHFSAFSRRRDIAPKLVSLNGLIAERGSLVQRLVGEDVEVVIREAPDLGQVEADSEQIEQILANLALNARDAMPDGGKLTLETANFESHRSFLRRSPEVAPGSYVMLAVTDDGVGMAEQVKAHIFEPFFTTKRPGMRAGLGLSTCFGIVKQHGGHILVRSKPKKGTTFRILLPRVDEAAVVASLPDPLDVESGPHSEAVLLAEDEPIVRTVIAGVLREHGYAVLEAGSGREALRIAESSQKIDLLVTDVVMPLMGGEELSEKLKTTHPSAKVLYVSGYSGEALLERGVRGPGTSFIQKPFTPKALASKVEEVLAK